MTPLTASAPLTWGDSNQSSSRSAMLMVIRRVTSAMVRTSRPRFRQASFRVPARSRGLREPMAGGTVGRRAAGLVAALQDHCPGPGPGQVGTGYQPVVPAADHDRVVGCSHDL